MSKVRVYEVAKQLNMDQKTLVALFQSMGVGEVRNHMSAVEVDVVERVKRHLERQKSPHAAEERIRPTVVKRAARRVADAPESSSGVPAPRASSPGSDLAAHPASRSHADSAVIARPPASEAGGRVSVHGDTGFAPPSRKSATTSVPSTDLGDGHAPISRGPASAPATRASGDIAEAQTRASAEAEAVREEPSAVSARSPRSRPGVVPSPPSSRGQAKAASVASVEIAPPPSEAKRSSRGRAAAQRGTDVEAEAQEAPARSRPGVAALEAGDVPPPPTMPAMDFGPMVTPPEQHARFEAPPVAEPKPASEPVAPPPTDAPVAPRSPSDRPAPRKTGIEVWVKDGVPVQQQRTTPQTHGPRRTVYDPRAPQAQSRSTGPSYGPGVRPGGPGQRPGQRQQFPRRNQAGPAQRKPVNVSTQEMSSHKKVIKIEEQVSLQQLASRMSLKSTDVLMRLLSMGMTGVNINTTLDADTAKLLASEFGWTVEDVAVSETDAITAAVAAEANDDDFEIRPPIVTVMGHVDHGKTSLLDRIRRASVAEGEAGGITQHVGAYRVETPRGTIAFLDTPGHEAFTAMRARGASVTDIVILVVAADDGVMPQTKEAINHAQAAKVPIIVAVNKIDKPGSDPDKIKRDLANLGLQPEEWGGQTIFAHVSAKTGEGIDSLLESVLLQAEVLELKASPKKRASGTVIEALLDRGRGPVARVMVQDGTLRAGDILLAGSAWGKVRAMTDELGRVVAEAGPATPVEVLGLNEVPSAGDQVHAVKDGKQAEEIAETRKKKANKSLIPQDSRISLDALTTKLNEVDQLELKLIIKGDVQGSVEAVGHALTRLSTQKVKVTVVHAAVGAITEGDVNLAVASKAIIAGFNVRPAGKAAALAESDGVEIRLYNIIYNAVDDIRSAMEGLLPATKVEKLLGKAEVRQVFRITKIGVVAGCMVVSGTMKRTADARLLRDNIVVWTGKLSGLRRFKDDVREVAEGFECGISLENYGDIKENDQIESFEIEEVKTKLS